jgi:hypothetical protein
MRISPGRPPHLRRRHPEDVELRSASAIASTTLRDCWVYVVDKKDPWRLLGSMDASSVICRSFLVATDACGPRWSTLTLPPGRNAGINRMG